MTPNNRKRKALAQLVPVLFWVVVCSVCGCTVLQMPMFAQTLFHHLIALPVNAVVEINTVVADAPLAQGVVVVEAQRIVNRHLMANFSSGGATVQARKDK